MEGDRTNEAQDGPTASERQKRKKFDVAKAYAKLGQNIKIPLQQDISILTLNIGGLRSPYRVESLKEMAHQLRFGIGVITETHMLEAEMNALEIPGYEIIHKYGISKFLGGVMILAAPYVSCKKLTTPPLLPTPIDACSCLICPERGEKSQI